MFEAMTAAAATLARPEVVVYLLLGTVVGWIFGVLPGLGSLQALVLVLPFTFGMAPIKAMFLYAGIMGATIVGGSVTSILLRIPGTAVNVATMFDGYAMTQKGESARAIGIAATASALGTFFGLFVLIAFLPISSVVLAFGPPEMFWLVMWGLTACVVISKGNVVKGLVAACLGLALSFVGHSNLSGITRYGFGSMFLSGGIPLVPFFIGLFGVGEVLKLASRGSIIAGEKVIVTGGLRKAMLGAKDVFRHKVTLIRSAIIGVVIGIIPGIGGSVSNLLAYLVTVQGSRNPEAFGKGNPEGVVAPEAANNATQQGALLTTVAFGVPGSVEMAILIGIFILHGLQPGPLFLRQNMSIVWAIILGMMVTNIVACAGTLLLAGRLSVVTRINASLIIPLVAVFSLIGVYVLRGEVLDIFLAVFFGLVSLGMERFGFSLVSLCIGFVMGTLVEVSFHQSLGMAWGSYAVFFTRPIAVALFLLVVLTLALPFLMPLFRRKLRVKR